MAQRGSPELERRVVGVAEAALERQRFVTTIDVLIGLHWLTPGQVDQWHQGRIDYLERAVQANLNTLSAAMAILRRWANDRGLSPGETAYMARTRDRRRLRFSKSGAPAVERVYRTLWVSPELSATERERLAERQSRPPDLVVISPLNDWTCTACSGTGDLLFMEGPGPLCLRCADLDHLVLLPAGDAALTRRAKRASRLSAVVVRFSRARKRYERQGLLVEETALAAAEQECLADAEARRRRRLRDEAASLQRDVALQEAFAEAIVGLFPGCPRERATAIADHAAARGSGRVGRTASGRALDPEAVTMAVVASVRHVDTAYDELLMTGVPRAEARARVQAEVQQLLDEWRLADESPVA